jgi:acyl dehydratase
MVVAEHARITDEALEQLRREIGRPITRATPPFYEELNRDAIRHFAWACGDDNPLWLDEAYAARTRWGGIVAPPCILYSANNEVSGAVDGLPGVHAMFAGTDWHWFKSIPVGTRVRTASYLKDLVEHRTAFAGRAFQQTYHVEFFDQHGEQLAAADSWCFRTERYTARTSGTKYTDTKDIHRYTREEVERIAAHYRQEKRRGATPRYWEDVALGDEIDPIVKGPYTVTTAVAWMQTWGNYAVRTHRAQFAYYDRHPGLAAPNEFGVPEPPVRVHWDSAFARAVGVPAAYDFGPERISWLGHLLTDWMGDDGFLAELHVQIRRHNLVGDTSWCRGRVTGKEIMVGQPSVGCDVWIDNQDGQVTAKGTARVVLPRRGGPA